MTQRNPTDKRPVRIYRTISRYAMCTFLSLYSRSSFTYTCGLLMVFISMIFLNTDTAVAQAESSEEEGVSEKESRHWRVGFNFSGYGFANYIDCELNYECIDNMPYPIRHGSVQYKNYNIDFSWSEDENEYILNFTARYNYYPLKKYILRPFLSIGFSTYYFNRKWAYRIHNANSPGYHECRYECSFTDNIIRDEEITDPEFSYELDYDRPDGKSLTLDYTSGIGIEYNISRIVFSHQFNWYRYLSYCPYQDFICAIRDVKFLGIHFMF